MWLQMKCISAEINLSYFYKRKTRENYLAYLENHCWSSSFLYTVTLKRPRQWGWEIDFQEAVYSLCPHQLIFSVVSWSSSSSLATSSRGHRRAATFSSSAQQRKTGFQDEGRKSSFMKKWCLNPRIIKDRRTMKSRWKGRPQAGNNSRCQRSKWLW